MATLTKQEIKQLQQQLEQKRKEFKEIFDKLVEAGARPLNDDILDGVAGGLRADDFTRVYPDDLYPTDYNFL